MAYIYYSGSVKVRPIICGERPDGTDYTARIYEGGIIVLTFREGQLIVRVYPISGHGHALLEFELIKFLLKFTDVTLNDRIN